MPFDNRSGSSGKASRAGRGGRSVSFTTSDDGNNNTLQEKAHSNSGAPSTTTGLLKKQGKSILRGGASSNDGADEVPPLIQRIRQLEQSLGVVMPPLGSIHSSEASPMTAADLARILFPQPFVGLVNLGATCYMNSLLQTFFTTPELREHIIRFPFEAKQRHARNVGYHLQLLCAQLQERGLRRAVRPKELVDSFGMEEAHREQHDVQELNRVLLEVLQDFVDKYEASCAAAAAGGRGRGADGAFVPRQIVRYIYEGKLLDVMRCTNCAHERVASTPFLDVGLPLCSAMGEAYDAEAGINVHKIEDCLDRYVAKETIDGVSCEHCNGRHPLEKSQQFDVQHLPRVLTLQLHRIHFNVATGRRDKVAKDIALPLELDMRRWSVAGGRTGDTEDDSHHSTTPTAYRLHAIICHRGTAYHGHYYTFVQCFPPNSGADDEAKSRREMGRWVKFDDDDVSFAQDEEVLEYLDPAAWRALVAAREEEQQKRNAKPADVAEDASVMPNQEAAHNASPQFGPDPLPQTATQPLVSGPARVDDDLDAALLMSLFDNSPATDGSSAGSDPPTSSQLRRSMTVSGHTYYAMYRRCDLPLFTGDERFDPPDYIASLLHEDRTKRQGDVAELAALANKTVIRVWLGDLDRMLTAQLHVSGSQSTPHLSTHSEQPNENAAGDEVPSAYRIKSIFVEVDWTRDCVRDVLTRVRVGVAEDPHLLEDEACVQLICDAPCRLRAFHTSMKVMGESFDDEALPLSKFLSTSRSKVEHFFVEMLPTEPTLFTIRCRPATKCDIPVLVRQQSKDDVSSFPDSLRRMVCLPANCSVEEVKHICSALPNGIPVDKQVLTVVVNGEPHVRSSGIFVGESIFVERKEAGRPVGNPPSSAYHDGEGRDSHFHGWVDGVPTRHDEVFPSRAQAFVAELNKTDVEYCVVPTDIDEGSVLAYIRETTPIATLRVDRRSTLRSLKLRLLMELFGFADAAKERSVQMWVGDKSVGEPRNLESSIFTTVLGATRCRVAIVHRPTLSEGERMAEVYLLPHPIRYDSPLTLLTRMSLNSETTVEEVIRCALPDEPRVPSQRADLLPFAIRPRLMPPNKTVALGMPMLHPLVMQNAQKHGASETLRIVLERIGAPEQLERSSVVLHVHRWNSSVADPHEALGTGLELVLSKELPASALKEQLSELLDIPVAELQAAPAKLYMLQRHDDVYTKLAWGILSDEKILSKPIAAHPLAIEMDEIVLVRRSSEPWAHVSNNAFDTGHLSMSASGGGVSSSGSSTVRRLGIRNGRSKSPPLAGRKQNSGATTAEHSSAGCKGVGGQRDSHDECPNSDCPEESANKAKKGRRVESGISIRAVWELEDEGEAAAVEATSDPQTLSAVPGTHKGSDETVGSGVSKSAAAVGEAPSGSHVSASAEESRAGGDAGGVAWIDFLECGPYDTRVHRLTAETCQVCYGDFADGEMVCVLPCSHIFHRDCLAPWLEQKVTCPSCGLQLLGG